MIQTLQLPERTTKHIKISDSFNQTKKKEEKNFLTFYETEASNFFKISRDKLSNFNFKIESPYNNQHSSLSNVSLGDRLFKNSITLNEKRNRNFNSSQNKKSQDLKTM